MSNAQLAKQRSNFRKSESIPTDINCLEETQLPCAVNWAGGKNKKDKSVRFVDLVTQDAREMRKTIGSALRRDQAIGLECAAKPDEEPVKVTVAPELVKVRVLARRTQRHKPVRVNSFRL